LVLVDGLGCGFGLGLNHGLGFLNTDPLIQNHFLILIVHFTGTKKIKQSIN
jgi:hypothetical protein